MLDKIRNSTCRIASSSGDRIGTGFIVHHDDNSTYVVTCLHVVKEMDVILTESIPSTIISKIDDEIDLVVLRTNERIAAVPFKFRKSPLVSFNVEIFGYQKLLDQFIGKPLNASLGEKTYVIGKDKKVEAYDITTIGKHHLERGYSGSPVIDDDGLVCGVAIIKDGNNSGIAIKSNWIESIWPLEVSPFGDEIVIERTSEKPEITSQKKEIVGVLENTIEHLPGEHLKEGIKLGKVVPLIGAGLSMSALSQGEDVFKMPNYEELLRILVNKAKAKYPPSSTKQKYIDIVKSLIDLEDFAGATEQLIGEKKVYSAFDFYKEIRSILKPLDKDIKPSPAHNLLKSFNFEFLITTNYDRLLENFVGTADHEVITPDSDAFQLLSQNVNDHYSTEKYILKLHGDLTRPETIVFGETQLKELYEPSEDNFFHFFLSEIFKNKIVLFLGCSFSPSKNEGQVKLLRESLKALNKGKPLQTHYALVEKDDSIKWWRDEVTEETGIEFIYYTPDENHSQVWEFISYLNDERDDEPLTGESWTQWYRSDQRGRYLKRQLFFEEQARSIRFLTPGLTNSITTKRHLEQHASKTLKSQLYTKEDVEENIIPAMWDRYKNLKHRLEHQDLEVRAMFLKSQMDADFENLSSINRERYQYLLDILDNNDLDVEIRLLPDLFDSFMMLNEASFAVILSSEPQPFADVAIAYASQADKSFFKIHTIQQNSDESNKKLIQFERYWSSAWSEQKSRNYLEDKLTSHKSH